jgi:hypothetical protein
MSGSARGKRIDPATLSNVRGHSKMAKLIVAARLMLLCANAASEFAPPRIQVVRARLSR